MTNNIVDITVKPATVPGLHLGQRYILYFRPHNPPDTRWEWEVIVRMEFRFYGTASTQQAALKQAKAEIDRRVDGNRK